MEGADHYWSVGGAVVVNARSSIARYHLSAELRVAVCTWTCHAFVNTCYSKAKYYLCVPLLAECIGRFRGETYTVVVDDSSIAETD